MAAFAEQIAASVAQDIFETQALLDKWVDRCKCHLEALEVKHERTLQDCESTLESLRKTKQDLTIKAEEGARVNREASERIAAMETEVEALRQREQELPQELEALQTRETQAREQLEQKRQEYEAMMTQRTEYVNDLTRGVLMYKHLGLDFERAPNNRLRLVFTQIDPAAPTRDFYFSVNVNDQDVYEVEECNPPIDGERMRVLIGRLNGTSDFSGFVKGMRREFQALVASSAGAN